MQNLLEELKSTLEIDDRLVIDGKLNKNKIVEMALALDGELLTLLLKNDTIKKHFFKEVSGTLIFDKIELTKTKTERVFEEHGEVGRYMAFDKLVKEEGGELQHYSCRSVGRTAARMR